MKKYILFLFLISNIFSFSQEDAWVYFKDKPDFQTYYNSPLLMLSQKSLDRRTTQNIPLDIKDVPLYQPYINIITASTGITVMAKSKWLNSLHIRGTQADINALKLLSCVQSVKFANRSLNAKSALISDVIRTHQNKFSPQTTYSYGNSGTQIQMIKGDYLHQQGYTGLGMVIAVLDAGFPSVNTAAPFNKIRTGNQILGGYDFTNRNTNFYTGNNHGTQVLSTIGGFATNLVGTAPEASFYLYITEVAATENPVEESYWVEAAEMADYNGVDIISSSLGYLTFDNTNYDYTYNDTNGNTSFISRGCEIAFSRGIICVISAGNEGANTEPHVGMPGDAVSALTIGSVTSTKAYSSFSSIGPSKDGRVKPDVMAMGTNSVVSNTSGAITTNSGTSFSCPIMAGAVACFWQAPVNRNKTNTQIIQMIKASSDRFASPTNQFGYGIPNFQTALTTALSTSEFATNVFSLYPNPSNNEVTLSNPDNLIGAAIKFYNNLGQLVLERKIESQSQKISLQSLNNGIYYYNIASAEKTLYGKLIKN